MARDLGALANQAQPESPSDAALVAAALVDPRRFADLYLRHANSVYRFALGRTRSDTQADDVVGDTFVRALETLASYDPARGSFRAWLIGIAGHRIADDRRRRLAFVRAATRSWRREPPEDDALDLVVARDDAERMRAALARLPDDEQQLVLLRYAAGLNSVEIGQIAGIAPATARKRLSRALGKLAGILGVPDA